MHACTVQMQTTEEAQNSRTAVALSMNTSMHTQMQRKCRLQWERCRFVVRNHRMEDQSEPVACKHDVLQDCTMGTDASTELHTFFYYCTFTARDMPAEFLS